MLVFLSCLLSIPGPSAKTYLADYRFLPSAEREIAGDRGSVLTLRAEPGSGTAGVAIADELFEFGWRINDYRIALDIANKSGGSAAVVWKEGAFVDDAGKVHALYAAKLPKEEPIDSTTLASRSRATFSVFPRDWMSRAAGWYAERLLFDPPGNRVGRSPEEIAAIASPVIGKTIEFRLPVVANGREYRYAFRFTVTAVGAREEPTSRY